MFLSFARRSIAAIAFIALAEPAGAATPTPSYYSPVADGIDKVCTPAARGTPGTPAVRLARLNAADGTPGPWLRSNPDLEERNVNAPAFFGGDFVIVRIATALFTASDTHRDATSGQSGPKTTAWCFEGGKLSRATFDLILVDQQLEYRHTQYFDTDLDAPTFDLVNTIEIVPRKTPGPLPSPSALAIQTYHTPEDLPFYEAYKAALDGKLPLLAAPLKAR